MIIPPQYCRNIVCKSTHPVAMGPWSTLLSDWLPDSGINVPLTGIKSTSIVFNNPTAATNIAKDPAALFCGENDHGCHLEVYPRPNGEVYMCGVGGSDHVEGARLREEGDCGRPERVLADVARVDAAMASAREMMPTVVADMQSADVQSQACMRPCAPDALPIIGQVPGHTNVYLNCGHNCWGILWGPVSGLLMSELIVHGATTTADISAFSPHRFCPKAKHRGRAKGTTAVGEQW
eukprot:m.1518347 g.1518347  ORF g.1518347 m.1518347 type:complete len:236 (+) comp25221_c2_seq1:134-841(+)